MTVTDPTFYRSAAEAAAAPPEKLAYVVAFDRAGERPDALTVVDVDEGSPTYGKVVGWADLPTRGDELHHFGWNACSSALKHEGHDMDGLERRYLLLPGLRSSNIHVYDTRPDPRSPQLHKTIDAKELAANAGYSRPHTLHCGPDGIFLSCLGGADGAEGPGGIALLDHSTFDVLRAWETDRGPAVPGLRRLVAPQPERRGHQRVGHAVDDRGRDRARAAARPEVRPRAALLGPRARAGTCRRVDLGAEHQMVLELRPSHDPDATWGFVGVVVVDRGPVGLGVALAPRRRHLGGGQGDHDPGRAGRPGATCRRRCSPSARCRRWSPTSTCPSTTGCSTSRAGAPASSSSTT